MAISYSRDDSTIGLSGEGVSGGRCCRPNPPTTPCRPQVTLANPSGFPLTAFGAIMSDDHQIPPVDLRRVHPCSRRACQGSPQGGR
jgi:hypothetical protein